MLADDRAGGARVVEVDVREEQVAEVAELEPALARARRAAGGSVVAGPQSKSAGPSRRLEQVDADRLRQAEEVEVDRLEHG